MSRPNRPRLSVVRPEAPPLGQVTIEMAIYRETDIRLAAERLYRVATRLHAIPRRPEVADLRALEMERFEEAVAVMKKAIENA
jgi:hypothetical protein